MERFVDRADAGRLLGEELSVHLNDAPVVVLGLPRGGVVVAYEVARVLKMPLDIVVVRKVGVPSQPELAMGALSEGGVTIRDVELWHAMNIDEDEFSKAVAREQVELDRRTCRYRRFQSALDLVGRTTIIVDDGIATGATARAAVASIRDRRAGRILLSAPIASAETLEELSQLVDDVVVLVTSRGPFSVGSFYRRFTQTSDREVIGYLIRARRFGGTPPTAPLIPHDAESSKVPNAHCRRSP